MLIINIIMSYMSSMRNMFCFRLFVEQAGRETKISLGLFMVFLYFLMLSFEMLLINQ